MPVSERNFRATGPVDSNGLAQTVADNTTRIEVIENSPGGDASQIAIVPDATIGLTADDVEEAIDELAAETQQLDLPDLTIIFQNSLA